MNIFIIPSWYPSGSNPIYGIFNREQALILSRERPSYKIGVSRWGQGEDALMLPALSPYSYIKLFKTHSETIEQVAPNLTEYFSPAFTWTRRFGKGNIDGILKANKRNLERHIEKYGNPDIICAQASYPAAIVARSLSGALGIPYTVTIYMSPFPFDEFLNRDKSLKSIIKEPLMTADRLFSSCNALKGRMSRLGLRNIDLLPLPVDTDYFIPEKTSKSSKVKILAIGRLEDQKGFDLLLEAVAKIKAPFELRIGGDGSMRSKYQALTKRLHLNDKVKWLGLLSKEQTRNEMQECDFFVLSSRHETFGLVQVEAMACGKPVVATRCGGPEDILTDKTGFLCNNLDIEDLTEKIQLMIESYEQFSPEEIREDAISRFGPKSWVNQFESRIKQIVQK
jgi:glycosyltransferase involved in cell wall biosynthesis